ncbi:MAG TPA: TfoX/Sxy family protein [Burkholderiales bacterium]|nr:TfoX/Sxy family protein [Burkholderiales bacterium]
MAQPTEFVRYVCERLTPLGAVSARLMFGGWGLYVDNQFCAIVHRDILYLRVDDMTRPDFEARGCGPFRPFADKAPILSYHEAPAEILEDAAEMLVWGHKALDAALRGRNTKQLKPRKQPQHI